MKFRQLLFQFNMRPVSAADKTNRSGAGAEFFSGWRLPL